MGEDKLKSLKQANALKEIAAAIDSARKTQHQQEKKRWLAQKDSEDRRVQANNLLQLSTLLFISVVAENLLTGSVSPLIIVSTGIVIVMIYVLAHKIMKGGGNEL